MIRTMLKTEKTQEMVGLNLEKQALKADFKFPKPNSIKNN